MTDALTREAFLDHAGKYDTREVELFGGKVWVRGMTAREVEIQAAVGQKNTPRDEGLSSARILARVMLDESGARMFTDADVPQIGELPWQHIQTLMKAVNDLSGLNETDEEIAKNSEAGQSGSSPTE